MDAGSRLAELDVRVFPEIARTAVPTEQKLPLTDVPAVLSIDKPALPKSGGHVVVTGTNLKGVQAYIDAPTKPLTIKDQTNTKFTVTIPPQTGAQVVLKFVGPDKKDVSSTQTIKITPVIGDYLMGFSVFSGRMDQISSCTDRVNESLD